jgi:hypothetical protein
LSWFLLIHNFFSFPERGFFSGLLSGRFITQFFVIVPIVFSGGQTKSGHALIHQSEKKIFKKKTLFFYSRPRRVFLQPHRFSFTLFWLFLDIFLSIVLISDEKLLILTVHQ